MRYYHEKKINIFYDLADSIVKINKNLEISNITLKIVFKNSK